MDINIVVYRSESYRVVEKLSVYWPQVFRIYLFMVGSVIWWIFLIWLFFVEFGFMDGSNAPLMMTLMLLFVGLLGMPLIGVVWLVRKNGKNLSGSSRKP